MNANDLTSKEIQFNIMVALMSISGSLSDLVTQGEICDYSELSEVNANTYNLVTHNTMEVNTNEPTRINK